MNSHIPTLPALGHEQQNHTADGYGHGGYEAQIDAFAFQQSET
jgi:hypothetical protein